MSSRQDDKWLVHESPPYESDDDPVPNHKELVERYDRLKYIELSRGIVYNYEWIVEENPDKDWGPTYECCQEIFKKHDTAILIERKLGPPVMMEVVGLRYNGLWARPASYPAMVTQDVERWGPKQFFTHDDLLKGIETDTLQSLKYDQAINR